jgi:hypothetical protein
MSRTRSRIFPALLTGAGLVVAVIIAQSLSLLPRFSNPVKEKEVDRSGPPLLLSLEDQADLIAASGNIQVLVDREVDVRYLPGVIAGERIVYQAVGSVDAIVTLSEVESRVVEDPDTGERTVIFTVPPARLGDAKLDMEESKVVESNSGLFNRIADFFRDNPGELQELQRMGIAKIEAAALESGVLELAERNARATLEDLAERAGADRVVVEFVDPTADDASTTTRPAA